MKLRPLIIDDNSKAKVKAVMDVAEVHRLTTADLLKIIKGDANPPGDDPNRVCLIDFGYRCVYTIEQQPEHGWCRHLSVSVGGDGVAPNPAAVLTLMEEFGFKGGFKDLLHIGKERIDNHKIAVNVMQKL